MDLVCHLEKTMSTFEENWNKYARIILLYSMSHSYRSKDVKEALLPLLDEEMPDNQCGYEIGTLM